MKRVAQLRKGTFIQNRIRAPKGRHMALLSLDWTRPKDPPQSLGHASILATLRQRIREYETQYSQQGQLTVAPLSFAVNHYEQRDLVERVTQEIADQYERSRQEGKEFILAAGAFVWNESVLQSILQRIRTELGTSPYIVLGGPQISYVSVCPDRKDPLQGYYPTANAYIRGYGENALSQWFVGEESAPRGMHFNNSRETYPVWDLGLQAHIDLENLPSPFLSGIIEAETQRFVRWETQRGCPFRCTFCQHRESVEEQSANSPLGRRRHFNLDKRLQNEIELFSNGATAVGDIAVLDPTFNSGPHFLDILDLYVEFGFEGNLALQSRFEMVRDEFLDRVQQLNQNGAQVTLEFGLQTTKRNEARAIERPNRMKKVEEVIRECNKRRIPYEISLIFGLPLQTLQSFRESVQWCLKNIDPEVAVIKAWPLMLLRGTKLAEQKELYGMTESQDSLACEVWMNRPGVHDKLEKLTEDIGRLFDPSISHVVASNTFDFDEWIEMATIAQWLNTTALQRNGHPSSLPYI